MTDLPPEHAFSTALLAWYAEAAAALPWRQDRDPYHVWLSEIMLQQTQVTTVIPYYQRFLAAYSNVHALAAAPLDAVLKQWEGLGYYSRARNLHKAAQIVSAQGGVMPRSAAALEALPGIGRYTANAIASICYGEPVAVLDGNVMRVLARLDDIAAVITERETQATLWQRASDLLPSQAAGDHNQAMMELGRTICRPRNPSCLICPVRQFCGASAHGTQAQRPVKAARSATPHYDVAAGVIWNDKGEILIAQRKAESLLGGLWEFPGGKQEAGETLPECLLRELREELAIEISVGEQIATVKHAFTHFKITLYAFCCQYQSGEPQAIGCAAWQWVQPEALDQFAFGKADREVIKVIKSMRST